jgi:enoyl-CoA hydratase/carnithine racemase
MLRFNVSFGVGVGAVIAAGVALAAADLRIGLPGLAIGLVVIFLSQARGAE